MTSPEIDEAIKNYIRRNLSPTEVEQDYVDAKFDEIDNFLAGECFRSGSFARYTAVRPIHDLDVIWITDDEQIWQNTESFMQQLAADIKEQYEEFSIVQPAIKIQTHSVTLLFNDLDSEFSIDVVPATPTRYRNKNSDPIFKVPEIIKFSRSHRESFYASHNDPTEIGWTYTDPKGYIEQSKALDVVSQGNHRKTAKFLKAWRNGIKKKHGDKIKLQAFHLEQICATEFAKNPTMSVYEAIRYCFSLLPDYIISAPYIEDRAYAAMGENKYIDDYLDLDNHKVTQTEKELIVAEIGLANDIMPKFVWDDDTSGVIQEILCVKPTQITPATPVTYIAPPAPWRER